MVAFRVWGTHGTVNINSSWISKINVINKNTGERSQSGNR